MAENKSCLSSLTREILAAIAEGQLEELWNEYSGVCCGLWVPRETVPTGTAEELLESGLIDDERRIDALQKGGEPTRAEIELYEKWWIEKQLYDDSDADLIPSYALAPVNDDDGHEGVALILSKGYAFSVVTRWLEGIFASDQEAIDHLNAEGWCS